MTNYFNSMQEAVKGAATSTLTNQQAAEHKAAAFALAEQIQTQTSMLTEEDRADFLASLLAYAARELEASELLPEEEPLEGVLDFLLKCMAQYFEGVQVQLRENNTSKGFRSVTYNFDTSTQGEGAELLKEESVWNYLGR